MKWRFAPLGWIFGIRKDAVIVHSYAPFVCTWPLILLGFLFYPMVHYQWVSTATAGWIYIVATLLVLLTMGVDINRNATVFWIILIAAGWMGIVLLQYHNVKIFGRIGEFIAKLEPNWTPDFGLAFSILLSIFFLLVVGNAWLNERWRFIPGEIEHRSFGRNDDSMGRGAKVISTSYPDILEMLLLLSGTITIYNAQKTMVLARITRVPLLPLRVKRINELLESVQVTPSQAADEETHGEQGHSEDESGSLQS